MPSLELVDRMDQRAKGRYHRGTIASGLGGGVGGVGGGGGADPKHEDLLFDVEDSGGGDGASASSAAAAAAAASSSGAAATEGYVGIEHELRGRLLLRRRRRNALLAAAASLGLSLLIAGAVGRRRSGAAAASAKANPSGSGGASGGKKGKKKTAAPSPSPGGATVEDVGQGQGEIEELASVGPTPSPPPAFDICRPPIGPDRPLERDWPVFHMGELRTVPEAPAGGGEDDVEEEYEERWEYTFSAMDISEEASVVAVGLSDFSNSDKFSAGMVRVFAWPCGGGGWRQLGQDLLGSNEGESFGHRVSSSRDGRVMAVSAPQESYDGGSGFVNVYFLNDGGNRWERLGSRIEDLESSVDYTELGHAIDLSDKGETLAVLGVVDTNRFVVRVFQYDSNKKDWVRKGYDLRLEVNYEDDYDYAPQLSLSDDGDELSVADPEFGVVRYHFHFAISHWEKQESKTVAWDDDDYWIESIDLDDSGNLVAFSAFKAGKSDVEANTVKVVDFANGTVAEVYADKYEDYAVGISVAVSDDGRVAAVVASKVDVDDDEFWSSEETVGALTVVARGGGGGGGKGWGVVGDGTAAAGAGVPGDFVTLSGDGRIAAVGSANVVALYGIALDGDGTEEGAGDAPSGSPGGGGDSSAAAAASTGSTFDICAPFPSAASSSSSGEGDPAGSIDSLPRQEDQHTLSIASSADGSVVAVGIDSYDGEDRGLARVFAWDCASSAYARLGQDLLGSEEFDGFGQSVGLSADGMTLAVGANQPPPGKSGYVDVYSFDGGGGEWKMVGHRLDNVEDSVGDVGREVRVSDDGSTVMFSGSILTTSDGYGYGYDASFVRVVENFNGQWKSKGEDLLSSIDYDEYGDEVHISLSGDGRTLGVSGSYSTFMAKVYTYDEDKKNWTESIIPPIKTSDNDDEDEWDIYYENYFSGSDIALNDDGTVVAIAGTRYSDDDEIAVVRVLKKDPTSGNWTLSHDPVDYADDYVASSVGISADGRRLAVGINIHSDDKSDQGALFVACLVDGSDGGWSGAGRVDGRDKGDLLGSRVSISRDGTIAAASSRKGYVSFFKIGC